MITYPSSRVKLNSTVTMSILIILLLIAKGVSAQQAIVSGALPQDFFGKSIKLTLIDYETRNDKVVQEAQIGQDGKFILTISLKEPEIYDLGVDNSSLVQVLAKPGDKIDLKINKELIEVTGSKETQYLIDYEANRKMVFNKYLKRTYDSSAVARQLVNKVNATKRIAIGAIAPGFVSTDTAGEKIDLKGYLGKYTFVGFWASWCAPCREESPTLVRLYNEYKDKGFAILSVSIDKSTTQWKNAIRQDGYTWENVCDLNGYGGPTAALYTVTAIPNSFLLDKNGRIIAKNLRGKALESKLAELMN